MSKWLIIIILAVLVLGGGFLLINRPSTTAPSPATTNPTEPAQTQTSADTVTISNFAFTPATISVKAGTTVTWINQDRAAHTVVSDLFRSPNLKTGDKFSYTFTSKGTFNYSCSIHPAMTATVIVQ